MPVNENRFYSVPELAEMLAVKDTKIAAWIKSGELKAATVSTGRNGKPRWRIRAEDFSAFWAGRLAVPSVKTPVTRTRRATTKPTRKWIT